MMINFGALPTIASTLIGCWVFILFLAMVFLLVVEAQRIRVSSYVEVTLISISALVTYLILQFIMGASCGKDASTPALRIMIYTFEIIPTVYIVLLCILLSMATAVLMRRSHMWNQTHISDSSIKEAVDLLPAGVCAYESSGRMLIKNAAMERLSKAMTGGILLNGLLFEKSILEYPSKEMMGGKTVYILPDEEAIIFSKETLVIDGNSLILLAAYDMTEEYAKTQVLLQKRREVQELNSKLMSYNRDIVSIITSQEILNAKVKIHDELGAGLLAIKHYLVNGGGKDEKERIIDKLNRNLSFLQKEMVKEEKDEYLLMFTTANALDVRIVVDGELPEAEPAKHIIATAIHECFTNTVRHAKGDLLQIRVVDKEQGQSEVIFTNNGNQPTEDIIERGGLASLRSLVEGAGGTMNIDIEEGFRLRIYLPERREDKWRTEY